MTQIATRRLNGWEEAHRQNLILAQREVAIARAIRAAEPATTRDEALRRAAVIVERG